MEIIFFCPDEMLFIWVYCQTVLIYTNLLTIIVVSQCEVYFVAQILTILNRCYQWIYPQNTLSMKVQGLHF